MSSHTYLGRPLLDGPYTITVVGTWYIKNFNTKVLQSGGSNASPKHEQNIIDNISHLTSYTFNIGIGHGRNIREENQPWMQQQQGGKKRSSVSLAAGFRMVIMDKLLENASQLMLTLSPSSIAAYLHQHSEDKAHLSQILSLMPITSEPWNA